EAYAGEDAPGGERRSAVERVLAARLRAGAEAAHRSLSPPEPNPKARSARRFPGGTARPLRADPGAGGMAVAHGGTARAGDALASCVDSPRRQGPGGRHKPGRSGPQLSRTAQDREAGEAQRRAAPRRRSGERLPAVET